MVQFKEPRASALGVTLDFGAEVETQLPGCDRSRPLRCL
jgi:hypothetical protein